MVKEKAAMGRQDARVDDKKYIEKKSDAGVAVGKGQITTEDGQER